MANKQKKVEEFIKAEKTAYTVKVTTIVKVMVIAVLLGASFVAGWNSRSDFANEVKSEVRTQMSAVQLKEQK